MVMVVHTNSFYENHTAGVVERLEFLGSVLHKNEFEEDMMNKIGCRRMKWRKATGSL